MQRTIAIEARRPAELQVGIRAMKPRLIDPHLIAPIGEADRPVILQLHQIVVERNLVNIGVHFDCFGMAKASRESELAVNAAVPRQLFQVQARHDERIHLELLHRQLSRHLIIAVQPDGKFTLQPARINFRHERYSRVFTIRFDPAAKVSLQVRANLKAHKPYVAFRAGDRIGPLPRISKSSRPETGIDWVCSAAIFSRGMLAPVRLNSVSCSTGRYKIFPVTRPCPLRTSPFVIWYRSWVTCSRPANRSR